MRRILAAAAVTTGLVLGVMALPALADPAPCPGPITTDYKLKIDLTCHLTITGAGVTIDFKGHTVDGAIIVNAPGVTLRKGTVVNGNIVAHAANTTLDRMEVRNGRNFTVQLGPDSLITRSTFIDNPHTAVDLYWGDHTRVERSRFIGNGLAINNAGDEGSVIEGNRFEGNGGGISIWDEDAYIGCSFCTMSNDVVVRDNVFTGNGGAISVRSQGGQTKRVQIVGNRVVDSTRSGIVIQGTCRVYGPGNPASCGLEGLVVEGNVVRGSGEHGIALVGDAAHLAAPGITLRGNTSSKNGGLGISTPGIVDGGGNRARKNGDPAQCVGVACT